jgi:hypothetical protein
MTDKLAKLANQVGHLGKPDNPFLDKRYSMNMPACDFTPWLMEQITENDWQAIRNLLSKIYSDTRAVAPVIDVVRQVELRNWMEVSETASREWKASLLITRHLSYDPSGANAMLQCVIFDSFFVHAIQPRPERIYELLKRINQDIQNWNHGASPEMKRAFLQNNDLEVNLGYPNENLFLKWLREQASSLRASLFYSFGRYDQNKFQLTDHYTLRQFGIDQEATRQAVLASGFFEPVSDLEIVAKQWKKDDLFKLSCEAGIAAKKSLDKQSLFKMMWENPVLRERLVNHAGEEGWFQTKPDFYSVIQEIIEFKSRCRNICLAMAAI